MPFLVHHVLQLDADDLRDPRPGGVRELEQRAIADAERRVGRGGAEQPVDLVGGEHRREGAPPLGRLEPLAGIAGRVALAHEKAKIGPDGRDLAVNRGRREAQVLQRVDELAQLDRGQRVGPLDPQPGGVARQAPHVAHIALDGMATRPRLEGQVVAELLQAKRPAQLFSRR